MGIITHSPVCDPVRHRGRSPKVPSFPGKLFGDWKSPLQRSLPEHTHEADAAETLRRCTGGRCVCVGGWGAVLTQFRET